MIPRRSSASGAYGAGKTTTLRCYAGLLYPTGCDSRVPRHVPSRREKDYSGRMDDGDGKPAISCSGTSPRSTPSSCSGVFEPLSSR